MSDLAPRSLQSIFERGELSAARVLVFGYIDLNVIDGSAFFVAGLASMLGQRVGVDVDVLSANRLHRSSVVAEMVAHNRVRVIDPFREHEHFDPAGWSTNHTLSRREAARAIAALFRERNYDAIIVRDTATARILVEEFPEIADILVVYVTGIAFSDAEPSIEVINDVRQLCNVGVRCMLQTSQMVTVLERHVPDLSDSEILVLGPFVPDPDATFEESYTVSSRPSRLIYAGKFFPNWIPQKIIAGFSYARMSAPQLRLDVAGDAFRHDEDDPTFVDETRGLLENTAGVDWHGGLPRDEVRALVRHADVGVSWRSSALDSSTEFSTKVLEYGALGRPSIVNRSPVNVSTLGEDYPLFVDDMSTFIELLRSLPERPDDLKFAARRCWDVARARTYSTVSEELVQFLGLVPLDRPNRFVIDDRTEDPLNIPAEIRELPISKTGARAGRFVLEFRNDWLNTDEPSVGAIVGDLYYQIEVRRRTEHALRASLLSSNSDSSTSAERSGMEKAQTTESSIPNTNEEIRSAKAEIDRLESQLSDRERSKNMVAERLDALRGSRLGKLQTWWWRFRK